MALIASSIPAPWHLRSTYGILSKISPCWSINEHHGGNNNNKCNLHNTYINCPESPRRQSTGARPSRRISSKADVPGMKKEDVNVSIVDGRTLEISGQRIRFDAEEQHKNYKWHRAERPHGSFVRRFQLPVNSIADDGAVTANVQDGVLTVTISKPPQPKQQIRHIQVA